MVARVVAQQWVSLDGFASGPGGEGDIFAAVPPEADAASMAHNERLLPSVAEVLLGRRSYEAFVQVWPTADVPIAARVNTVPKVVLSRTLTAAPWGGFAPARVERDAVGHVRRRRQEAEGDLLLWGSLDLMATLLAAGEVDELDLFVAPLALGGGSPLLPPGLRLGLELVEAETWPGVVHLRYRVRTAPGAA